MKNTSQLERKFKSGSFVSIAGEAAVYLSKGKHYKALAAAESEMVWGSRKRLAATTAPHEIKQTKSEWWNEARMSKDIAIMNRLILVN